MSDGIGLLGLLALLFGGKGAAPEPTPRAPAPAAPPALPPAPAPWPQVAPTGLPPFPGSGWEYDEPPPLAVQQRAAQLVSQLWAAGAGASKIEQTAGRWIAYRAEKVRSGKQGVVAYRQATKRLPAPAAQPKPAQQPAPAKPVVRSPGVPQAPARAAAAPAAAAPVINVPATSPMNMPDLKYGMGLKPAAPVADVALVQQKLGVAPIDGRFGKDTQTAVIKFQQRTGLAPANQTIEQLRARGFGAVKQATWIRLFAS